MTEEKGDTRQDLKVGAGEGAYAQALIELAGAGSVSISRDGKFTDEVDAGALVVPQGMRVVDLKRYLDARLPAPRRTAGVAELQDVASFCAHAKRHGTAIGTAVFAHVAADRSAARLESVIDYDQPGAPAWRAHRGVYRFPVADEWQAWTILAPRRGPMSQADFADFLEAHLLDVLDPDRFAPDSPTRATAEQLGMRLGTPNALLTLGRGLALNLGGKVRQVYDASSGAQAVEFVEEHSDGKGGKVDVPQGFAVGIPVFKGGPTYTVLVRLRYRVVGASIVWLLAPHRAELVFDAAFGEACQAVADETEMPVLRGEAEPVAVIT